MPEVADVIVVDLATDIVDIVVLGKIVGPHGIQGAVRVYPYADDPMSWARLPYWWVGQEGSDPASWRKVKVAKCLLRNAFLVVRLACIADRTAAEGVQGLMVGAPRECLPATAAGEYYWGDLLGLDVVNTRGQALGRVLDLIETPANAVLRVGDDGRAERLLPFVAATVIEVDLVARLIRVDWEVDW